MSRVSPSNVVMETRHYGTHVEDLSYRHPPRALDAQELADAKRLLDVLVVGKPGVEPPASYRARVADSACITTAALGVPDLPSISEVQASIVAAAGSDSGSCSSSSFD